MMVRYYPAAKKQTVIGGVLIGPLLVATQGRMFRAHVRPLWHLALAMSFPYTD